MIERALDINWDFTFGKGKSNFLSGNLAIAQNIKTHLLSFYKDCFFDTEAGVDWFRLLGSLGQITNKTEIQLRTRAIILQCYGVVRIVSLSSSVSGRALSLSYIIDTIYTSNFSQSLEVYNV
jgi:hypothetical protein